MQNNNSNTLIFLSGIIAGAAALHFIKSPKGKEVIKLLIEKGEELTDKAETQTEDMLEKSKDLVASITDEGESLLNKAKENLTDVGKTIKDKTESSLSDFEKGVQIAKKKLQKA